MRARDFLYESSPKNLSFGSLTWYEDRPKIFADLVRSGHAFTANIKTMPDVKQVIIDPVKSKINKWEKELTTMAQQKLAGKAIPAGSVPLVVRDAAIPANEVTPQDWFNIDSGRLIKDTALAGGAGSRGGTAAEKEKVQIKPAQFFGTGDVDKDKLKNLAATGETPDLSHFIEAGAFPAGQLYTKIKNNPNLSSLSQPLANAIVTAADQIQSGQKPKVPHGITTPEQKAFRDYATEYLGVLALIAGGNAIVFPESEEFYKHLDKMGAASLNDLMLYFPKDSGNPLADSIALTTQGGKSMNISNKAGESGAGAAPSMDSLVIPDTLQGFKDKSGRNTLKSAINFIQVAQNTSGFLQPFALANLLINKLPIAQSIGKFDLDALQNSFKSNTIDAVTRKYLNLLTMYDPNNTLTGPPLGKLRYAVAKEVIAAVNSKSALLNFKAVVLEILGYNFVQLNTKATAGHYVTSVHWPAKLRGDIIMVNKYGAKNTGGKLSFAVKP
jgi:hypothetical protein